MTQRVVTYASRNGETVDLCARHGPLVITYDSQGSPHRSVVVEEHPAPARSCFICAVIEAKSRHAVGKAEER